MATTLTKSEPRAARTWTRQGPLTALRDELRDLLAHTFGEEDELWPFGRFSTPLDVSETDQAIEVRVDLPGIKPDEVDLKISGNTLTISGERREDREEKGRTWHRTERRTGRFSRSVMLPCPVKENAADAQYRDGVLTVSVPKAEEAKAHKIAVHG